MEAPGGSGLSDHACWAFSSDSERVAALAGWLGDGLCSGQRALYVADRSDEELLADVGTVPGFASALDRGALVVMPASAAYDLGGSIDPVAQLARYAAALDEAIADGYSGLRVAADLTPLVADRARRGAHLRWEQFADRYITDHPLAPLCLYDGRRISDLEAIVCAHPLHGPNAVPFALYATTPTSAAFEGEADAMSSTVLVELLAGLPATDRVVDLSRLSFIDGRAAGLLHAELVARRAAGQELAVTGVSPIVRRIWELCQFDPGFLAA